MVELDITVKKRKYCPSEMKRQVGKAQFNFQPLSSTEREAGDSVGQVGAKHLWLACASLLNYQLFH